MSRLDDIEASIAALQTHVAALHAAVKVAPAIRFYGGWKDHQAYPAGAVVQSRGSLFVALVDAEPGRMPGDTEDDRDQVWRLAVRRGRDGRDADVQALEKRVRALEQRL
jgi:hypothetical protein